MKIFRVHKYDSQEGSQGYEYFTARKDAEKCLRDFSKDMDKENIQEKEIQIGKYEFLKLLNEWASHPDNG